MVTQDLMTEESDLKLCECGCGQVVKLGRRFISGHNTRVLNPIPKGTRRPQEFCNKMSQTKQEFNQTERGLQVRKEMSDFCKRDPIVFRNEAKWRESLLKRGKIPLEVRKKISRGMLSLGARHQMKNPSVVEVVRAKNKEWYRKHVNPMKGKHHTEKATNKMKLNHADRKGEKNPNYRGGKSKEPYGLDFDTHLKLEIKKRDKNMCLSCGSTSNLCIHHIDYDKKNNSPNNLITTCRKCNSLLNYHRDEWVKRIGTAEKWYDKSLLIVAAIQVGACIYDY